MTDLPVPPTFDSLDQILTEEAGKVTAWDDVHCGRAITPDGVAAWGLEERAQAFGEHEERLGYLLAALGELVGPAVLLEIREQVAGMLDTGRALHQAASTAEGSYQGAQQRLGEVLDQREAARRTATLLEAHLEQAQRSQEREELQRQAAQEPGDSERFTEWSKGVGWAGEQLAAALDPAPAPDTIDLTTPTPTTIED